MREVLLLAGADCQQISRPALVGTLVGLAARYVHRNDISEQLAGHSTSDLSTRAAVRNSAPQDASTRLSLTRDSDAHEPRAIARPMSEHDNGAKREGIV